uniref:Zinc finger Ran-binding domain-containing protein 2 n=1 Tax=Steinernema glaseri TaxID=37863 RepID=A0A1I8AAQ1_9BILA
MSSEDGAGSSTGPVQSSGSRRVLKEGEWACTDAKCAYINKEHFTKCRTCGREKPRAKQCVGQEIGKDVAEKSKGLFSPQDWVCTKCNNVNWARRNVCNVCNTKKFGGADARTGYGGGYMDRQEVEYISRKVDEEFDEFGRKKKSSKKDTERTESEAGRVSEDLDEGARDHKEEGEEEEEEESDGEDLGKYEIGSDDEFEALKSTLAKKVAEATNNSRQSSPCSCSCSEDEICSCDESDNEVAKPHDHHRSGSESRSERRRDRDRDSEHGTRHDHDRSHSRRDRDSGRRDHRHHDRRDRDRDSGKRDRSRSRSPRSRQRYAESDSSRRSSRR